MPGEVVTSALLGNEKVIVPKQPYVPSADVQRHMPREQLGALRLREARENRGVSREDLATKSNLDVSDIANIETGTSEASLGTLWKLAAGLGVPFSELLESEDSRVSIQRAAAAQVLRTADGILESRPLVTSGACRWVETYALELAPGGRHASDPHPRGTREIIVVISGSLSVDIENRIYTLDQGDSISFLADLPHAYENPGNAPGHYHDIIVYDK